MAGAAEVGETYDLTGPDAPTLEESAARAGELLGTLFAYLLEEEPTDVGPEWKTGIRMGLARDRPRRARPRRRRRPPA